MNIKLKFALIRRYSDRGFAMPTAIGMGFIMLLIAATMIVRSQGDQVTASAQKATTDSLNVAETGITRVQSLLKRFPKIAEKPKSDWAAEYNRLSAMNTCLSNTQDSDLISNINNWITLDSSDLTKGEIKILDYTYDAAGSVGTLKVAGRARSENGSAASSVDNADTYLEVRIPIITLQNPPIPGLWAKTFSMGNNDVSGNVLVAGCSLPPSSEISTANIVPRSGTLTANPSLEYPPLPDLPAVCPTGTATTPCYQVFKQNNTTYDATATTADAITTSYVKTSGTLYSECLTDADGYLLNEDNQGDLHIVKVNGNPITGCAANVSYWNQSKGVAFPRINDKAGSDGVYRYLIRVNSGNNSIELKGGNKIIITPGQKVVFYLQGNINMTGQSEIKHNGTPTNFQVFGSDGAGKYKHTSDTTSNASYKTTSVMLSGNTSANMFIYAPEATVGVNGGGNVASTITGSVWAKSWNGSSANQLIITQSADWTDLPLKKPTKIGSISSWQRASN